MILSDIHRVDPHYFASAPAEEHRTVLFFNPFASDFWLVVPPNNTIIVAQRNRHVRYIDRIDSEFHIRATKIPQIERLSNFQVDDLGIIGCIRPRCASDQQNYSQSDHHTFLWPFTNSKADASRNASNQSMKPTAPWRNRFSVFATTPWISSRCPASLA